MKNLLYLPILFLFTSVLGQSHPINESSENVIMDNDKIKVVEFIGLPQNDVCGEGVHQHAPHLTLLLSDVKVQITSEDGKPQTVEAPLGTSIWSERETHSAINLGDQPTKVILVYLKE